MGYFDRVDDRVTVSLHILYTANQETEGSQDRQQGYGLRVVTRMDTPKSGIRSETGTE